MMLLSFSASALALIQTNTIYQMDDTYVNDSAANSNFDNLALHIGRPSSDMLEAWFKFNLSDATGYYVVGASLWTYVYSVSNNKAYDLHNASSATWTENDLTWSNKPTYGGVIAQNTIATTGWWSWTMLQSYSDVFNSGGNFVSYALLTSGTGSAMILEDKENTVGTGNLPYLNLTMMIPEVYPLSPASDTSTYNTTIIFSYNTTDAGNIVNCSLISDGLVNRTNSSVPENISSSFTLTGIFPGQHTWSIRCYDSGRYSYEMNTDARNITILAKVEWTNPSSAMRLDLGTALIQAASPTGTRQIYSNNSNNNVQANCASGDCTKITTNWTTANMTGAETRTAGFECLTQTAGSFSAAFQLTSSQDATPDTLDVNCTILAPDLRINTTNITFSDNAPSEGEIVTISAGVYNMGSYEATNAVIRFYEGNYTTGTQIGSDHTITLSAGASTVVTENWTAKIGSYDIYVALDPPVDSNGSINESNESNNYAYRMISIPMWTVFVGNVTGSLALQTADAKTLMKWNVTDTTSSIIYVTDTDSNPDFSSLTAFGRNTTGAYMSNDFTEIDSAINTTNYTDSVNLTYTNAGTPVSEETFNIFGKTLSNVPIINSTNSTTFVTGILWDASDDSNSNHQFDNSSEEDVVFITRVNQTKTGKYGTYDYEIRVPARLKNYKEPDVLTVTFYTEIK